MATNLVYRKGTTDDLKQIKELAKISYGQYATVLTPENWETLSKFLNDEKAFLELIVKSIPFVCVNENNIVGMAFLFSSGNPTDIYPAGWSYIRMVGVHSNWSGQGIGRKLTQICIEQAKDLNEKMIALHTSEFMDAARHIYESLGFTIYKEIPPRFGRRYWLYILPISSDK